MLFLEATVMATSAMPMRVTLELLDGGRVVAEQPVVTLPGARPLQVEMSYEPRTAGRRTFIARVRPPEDLPDIGKNQAETTVEIVDRKIRVLLIDAEPRWEFRFIRSVIERDPGVTPTICLLRPGVGPIKGAGYLASCRPTRRTSPTTTWSSWATCRATCCPTPSSRNWPTWSASAAARWR